MESADLYAIVKTRIYQGWGPQNPTFPYLTLTQISNAGQHHLGGAVPLGSPNFQIDAWTKKGSQRDTIAEAVRNVLDGYRGTISGVDIRHIRLTEKGANSEEAPSDARGKPIFRVRIEAEVVHREAAPTMS